MRWPGVMRRVVEGGGELGAGKRGGEGDVGGGSGAPPLLSPPIVSHGGTASRMP